MPWIIYWVNKQVQGGIEYGITDLVNIHQIDFTNVTVVIYSTSGQLIKPEVTVKNDRIYINLEPYAKGIYSVLINTKNLTFSKRIVKL